MIGGLWSQRGSTDLSTGPIILFTPTFNVYTWTGNIAEPNFSAITRTPTNTTIDQSGMYSVARFSLANPLKLIVGGRLSNYEITQKTTGSISHDKDTNRFLPYGGIVYDLNKSYSFYSSYTRIFSPQPQGVRDRNGNVLPPSDGNSVEVGTKATFFDGRLNASIALFDAHLNNVPQIDIGHILNDGTQAYYGANGTVSRGIEGEVQGAITNDWNLSLVLSHFKAFDEDRVRLNSQVPRSTARIFTTYRLPDHLSRLTVGGGANWQSYFYQDLSMTSRVGQGSYVLESFLARYEIGNGTAISVNLNSLSNKRYYTQIGLFNQFTYGEPRSFQFGLTKSFKTLGRSAQLR